MEKTDVLQWLDQEKTEFADISNQIWDWAEIGFQEIKSSEILANKLRNAGFVVNYGLGGMDTAFRAVFGQGSPRIAFLGEYDALPGMNQAPGVTVPQQEDGRVSAHGCGHHLLGTASAAAAIAVKNWITANGLDGTIEFYGCPAEENGSGKAKMAKSGAFDGLHAILTWHPSCFNAVLAVSMLANYKAQFSYTGKAAHAAIAPHLGRSALDAVELMNVGANFLREHITPQARLHYAITDAGGDAANVVQAHASVEYLVRAPQLQQVSDIYRRLCMVAQGAGMMTETKLEITLIKTCANILNNTVLERVLQHNLDVLPLPEYTLEEMQFARDIIDTMTTKNLDLAEVVAGKQAVISLSTQTLHHGVLPYVQDSVVLPASSDVGDASWNAPTAQFSTACFAMGTAEHSWQLVAQGKTSVAHKGMIQAAKVMACSAIDLFESRELLNEAQSVFKQDLAGRDYKQMQI